MAAPLEMANACFKIEELPVMYRWKRFAQFSAFGACCSLVVWISSTSAKDDETSILVKKPDAASTQGPVLPPPAKPGEPSKEVVPPQQAAAPTITLPKPQPTAPRTTSTVKRPFMQPAQPREPAHGQLSAQSAPLPAPEAQPLAAPTDRDSNVHPAPPIVYDSDHDARKMYRSGQVQLVMVTQDPSDGCCYEIPLCIPACCTGEPKVSSGRGLLGRGVVEYCWSCGFRAIVKFRHIRGDVRVDYEGD
jgi:hypothetical protein